MSKEMLEKEIERLRRENDRLRKENKKLEEENEEIRRILTLFVNPHTPPSKQRFAKKAKVSFQKKLGAPVGHNGATRKTSPPTKTISHFLKRCPYCAGSIIKLPQKLKRVIEEIPEPRPAEVTEHLFEIGVCKKCGKVISENDLPEKGDFGKNLLSHVTLLKFEDRLPLRKVVTSLKRQHNVKLTHTTVLDITKRVSDKLREQYQQIIYAIRKSRFVYTDQTDIKVQGITYQLWIFVTAKCTLFIIRKAGYKNVMETVLGKKFNGVIVGDGLETYRQYSDKIQRCWAHLLRESAALAEEYDSAKGLHEGLKKLYGKVNTVTCEDPPDERQKLYERCVTEMQQWVDFANSYKELRKFAVTLENGLKHWFTRILYPFVEPTNNIAERALRELVVMRKIIGTWRNRKGTEITETIMTMITTWQQRGLDTFSMMRNSI